MVKPATRSGRKEDQRGREEEECDDREGQEGDARKGTRAQARRRYGPQGRLAHLISPWWARERRWLRDQVAQLEGAGFRVRQRSTGAHYRLDIAGADGAEYDVTFPAAFLPGQYVVVCAQKAAKYEYANSAGLLAAVKNLAEGGGRPILDHTVPRIVVPEAWFGAKYIEGSGTLRVGRAVIGGGWAVRSLDGTPEGARLMAAADRLASAFPALDIGIWASGTVPRSAVYGAEATVAAAEPLLAERCGGPERVREYLRWHIGAVASPDGAGGTDWEFVRRDGAGRAVVYQIVELPEDPLTRWTPFFEALAAKRVTIVGCGAVGWSVAHLLVRSGVGHLSLFDPEMVEPTNLARLGAFVGDAGRHKVEALADQLRAAAPGVDVTAMPLGVGYTVRAQTLIEDRPDLILDLTAEARPTDEVNLAALATPCDAIFAWLSNGVVAARMIRVRPYASACYECVRSAQPARLDAVGPIPPGGTWLGAAFDVEAFAGAVARMAARTLRGEPVGRTNPDHVVLHFGSVAPTEQAITIERRANCYRCGR